MKLIRKKGRPLQGRLAHVLHFVMTAILPVLMYILIYIGFGWLAVGVVLLSKWRVFAVKPRHWPMLMRANAVDVFLGVSVALFMINSTTEQSRIIWLVGYVVWLLLIKPRSSSAWVGLQALLSQAVALVSLFYNFPNASIAWFVFAAWVITYLCARHFLVAFDESMARGTAYVWGFFSASLVWLLSHWLIFYGPVAQPALLISVIGYGLALLYYLKHIGRLTQNMQRQMIAIMAIMILVIIIFSDWSDITI